MVRKRKRKRDAQQTIVKTMGMFWEREKVRWRGNRGIGSKRLAGKRALAKGRGEVDFWKQTGIYALYADYHLVYVGQAGLTDTSCLGARLKTHLTDNLSGRWNMFSWFGLEAVISKNALGHRSTLKLTRRDHLANVLEGIVIEFAEPPLNNQKGRFGHKVERYVQVDDAIVPEQKLDDKLGVLRDELKRTKLRILKEVRRT